MKIIKDFRTGKIKMKKLFALTVMLACMLTFVGSSFARTMEEEKTAVREYLKVLDAKIIKARNAGQKAKLGVLKADKAATLRRWAKLKAELEAAQAPQAPAAPAPAAPAPAPSVSAPAPAAQGMGLALGVKAGLIAGLTGIAGDLDYAIDSLLPGAKVRLGADYVSGKNPNSTDNMKAVNVNIGGTYSITDMVKSLGIPGAWYVGAAYKLPVKVNLARTGKWGVEAFVGGSYMIPDFGSVYGELGYAGLKYATNQPALKGVNLMVGYCYMF